MTPKFFAFLWILFFASAGVLWLADVFTLTTLIVFGFTAFGLVFTGMMCVLPGMVAHPAKSAKVTVPKSTRPVFKPVGISAGHAKLRFQ
jgi:hypothetical protein